jgi:uncharacterized protein YoxC
LTAEPLVGIALALAQTAAPTSGLAWWASTLANISTIIIAVALVILSLVMVPSAFSAGRIYRRINGLIDSLHNDATPILLHVRDITDNLNYISASIRDDVEGFKATIQSTQERLNLAAANAERRINDFNALLGVVQQEAESLFIDTASTIRGVRAGTDTLRHPEGAAWDDDEQDEISPSAASARGELPRH